MKKILFIGLLTSTLFYGCTFSIGGGCKCSGDCGKPQKIEIINQTPTTTESHCESTEEPIDTLEQY
jgi:hypothetical protein